MAAPTTTPNLGLQDFFSTTLSSTISSTDTVLTLATVPTASEGFLCLELGTANQEIIYYNSKTSNTVTCPSVSTGRGQGGTTAVGHSAGASAKQTLNAQYFTELQNGHALNIGAFGATAFADGWIPTGRTLSTVTYNGNRNYSLVFNSTDMTGFVSNGMRLKLTRTVTAPTQCTSLNGTTQYYSKTSPAGMTFTDDFVVSAWIKLSSYATGSIASRYNGTSGWDLSMNSSGQLQLLGFNAGASNYNYVQTYQSLPLNKWVHVAAQLDMSAFTATTTTSYTMIDGVDVPAAVFRGGTNPTALVQAGNLEIGSRNAGTQFFPGKIAQVAIYSAKVAQATITASIPQGLAGTETSLISAYSFNNSINDLNANANNLTANGSAVATNADSPFAGGANASTAYTAGTTEFGEVFNISFSTNTTVVVQVPDGYSIPTSGGVSAVAYSTSNIPLGWPGLGSVLAMAILKTDYTANSNGSPIDIPGGVVTFYCPPGRRVKVQANSVMNNGLTNAFHLLYVVEGSTTSTIAEGAYQDSTANIRGPLVARSVYAPTTGSHTYKLMFYCNQNSNSNVFGSDSQAGATILTVELEPVV